MLFFAVSSAGSCSPTSLPGFRHPGFRLSFRSSLLSGSLPSSRLSLLLFLSPSRSSLSGPYAPPPGILLGALLSLRFSPLLALSPLGSLSSPLYPLPGFLFSSCSPPLALLLPACPLLPARTLLLPARPLLFPALLPSAPSFSPSPLIRGRGASRRPCGAALRADRRGFRGSRAASCRGCRTPGPRCGAAAP